ncbi:MAG TPA: hypothetical protein VEK84_08230 [Terriglobales bacterium]|nr:hypothetical protein [Terriglobales bacterium]
MHRSGRVLLLAVPFVLASAVPCWPKESSDTQARPKVCVAVVANRTGTSLFVERMTERLTKSLVENKLAAVAMDSATTDDRELHPTLANSGELKRWECDFLVLTQVRNPKDNLTEPRIPPISIGGKVPSTDASDPMGGQSGPVYRDNLEIDFALFRPGKFAAMTNTKILAQPSANVSDSLMQAMDRVANRVGHDLKKK